MLVVIGSTLWMYLDSRKLRYDKRDVAGLAAMSPGGWLFAGLFLWLLAFPLYLASRGKLRTAGEARLAQLTAEGKTPERLSFAGPMLAFTALGVLALFALLKPERAPEAAWSDTSTSVVHAAAVAQAPSPKVEEDEPGVIPDGTYAVGAEIEPGVYRVGKYWARLDRGQNIIDNDLNQGTCPSLVVVRPNDAYVEIRGKAVAVEAAASVHPIEDKCTGGTFLVGKDIEPGRYRIEASGQGYWARLNAKLGTIANQLSDGQLIVVVRPTDFAVKLSGVESMERMPDAKPAKTKWTHVVDPRGF